MTQKEYQFSFDAVAKGGKKYRIDVFQEMIDDSDLRGGGGKIPGLKSMRTSDGKTVNYKSKGVYEVLDVFEQVTVTSDDPNAP